VAARGTQPDHLPPASHRRRWPPRPALLLAIILVVLGAAVAHAQFSALNAGPDQPISKDQPVFYQADRAEYDRDNGYVTLTGRVEIWQGLRDIRADKVTYDRNTGVVAASGHVVMLEPDGQVIFGDYAELTQGMRNGIISNMRAQLAQNGHLAANGARRIEAQVNELSRVIYSTCDACKDHPDSPRLWDLRARSAIQDLDNKRIEYQDAVIDFYGVPTIYTPYFSQPDPSAKRSTGLLVPSLGTSKYLGAYTEIPYYWAINDSTDATISPLLTTADGDALNGEFRHQFNNGTISIDGSLAYAESSSQADVFAKGQFAIDDEWRWGFDLERASSQIYMRDYAISGTAPAYSGADVLTSQIYLEGFGQGSYSRLDMRAYQALTTPGVSSTVIAAQLPYVLPRYEYSLVGEPDLLGGRASLDLGAFNVIRDQGTNTERASLSANWERPVNGALGDLWKFVLHVDSAAYAVRQLDSSPSWGEQNATDTAQAMPTAAVELHWPFQRDTHGSGTQVVEPIVQLIAAPNGSSYGLNSAAAANGKLDTLIPNEDSLDFEFTDATLFSLNRFYGIDRLEGGMRANVALHAAWFFPNGQLIDTQIGQGYRTHAESAFPVGSGLNDTATDVVGHVTYMPNSWFDITTRERFDHQDFALRFADTLVTGGPSWLRLNAGYLYTTYDPFLYYDTVPTAMLPGPDRSELTFGGSTSYGHWRLHASARRNLETNQMVSLGVGGGYEDECLIFDVEFNRRYTSLDGDNGASTLLFQLTLKTVGTFGFNAL
jgi:LPS-assembly protein